MRSLLAVVLGGLVVGCVLGDRHPLDMGQCELSSCNDGGGGGGGTSCDGRCDMAVDMAPSCKDDSTCPASAPVCSAGGTCGACQLDEADAGASLACASYHSASTPATPLCGPAGACVECLGKQDCAANHMACNLTTYACGPCSQHADCATGVCMANGSCADASQVAYVNNATAGGCTDATHVSSPTAPYCKISEALSELPTARPYIVVAGTTKSYDALSVSALATAVGPLSIVGPGRPVAQGGTATQSALIAPATGPAVSVATQGSNATLTIDGLELVGASGFAGVKCQQVTSGTPTLTVKNSFVHGSGLYGVDASSCTLTLDANVISGNQGGGVNASSGVLTVDANVISGNQGGGITIAGSSYTISNNLITDNGLNGPGVLLSGNVSGLFWFNTVVNNKRSGTNAGAFNCGGVTSTAAPVIQASIVYLNDKNTSGSSTGTGCTFTYSDLDDGTMGQGDFSQAPNFVDSTNSNWRIQLSSPCVDKITTSTGLVGGTLPDHDVDGIARPRAATGGYDCGASQAH